MKRRPNVSTAVLGAVLVFFYVPIVRVTVNAFNADETLNSWGGFTLRWFDQVVNDPRIRDDFVTSLAIALTSTAISVLLALSAAVAVSRLSRTAKRTLMMTTYARMMLPEVVVAVGLLMLLRELELTPGMWSVVAGHVIFCSAYATIVIQARYATFTGVYDEAAADLGASPWRVFRRVLLPMLLPAISVASLLSFTFSFDDVVSTLFLAGPDIETLPVLMLGLTRQGVSPDVNAIAVSFMAVTMLTLTLFGLATNSRSRAPELPPPGKDIP